MRVHVPSALRQYTDGAAIVEIGDSGTAVDGAAVDGTVASALEALFAAHPGVRDRLLNEQGNLRPHVQLFVGKESIRYTGGFETPIQSDDDLTILPAVSGG